MYKSSREIIFLVITILVVCGCSRKFADILTPEGEYIDVSLAGVETYSRKDQSMSIQKVFDRYRGFRKFYFPKGTYYVDQLNIYEGIEIRGTEDTWFVKRANSAKFSRMLNTVKYSYSSSEDSRPIVIDRINFDGNRLDQGEYQKYELEHQAMIFLHADKRKKGRLRAKILNCKFKEGVGDAISIYNNVDVVIRNCEATNVFRGGVTITGGHTKVKVDGFVAGGDVHSTGVDIEVDGHGYNNSKRVDVEFLNMTVDGDFDVGISGGSRFYGENIVCMGPPYNLYAAESSLHLKGCEIHTRALSNCKIYFPHDVLIEDSDFIIGAGNDKEEVGAMLVYWSTSSITGRNSRLRLKNVNFSSESKRAIAIKSWADDFENNNVLDLENVTFSGQMKHNLYYKQGGTILFNNVSICGEDAVVIGSLIGKAKYRYNVDIKKVKQSCDKGEIRFSNNSENSISTDSFSKHLLKERNAGRSKTVIRQN